MLTTTEYEVLRFLVGNPKRVLSKAQILDRVCLHGRSNYGGANSRSRPILRPPTRGSYAVTVRDRLGSMNVRGTPEPPANPAWFG
jgi:hypothetical protein